MAFNTGFLLPALTAIYSLFINNNDIRLRILYVELSDSARTLLGRLQGAGNNNKIEFIPVDGELLERIKVSTGRWRQETFFRYYVTEILPGLDRVMWLDADILVRRNIEDLYNVDFEGRSFAGVFDNSSNPVERLGLRDYINAGILMINAGKLKSTGKMNEFWNLVASPDYTGELPDQDALNIVFNGDIKIIGDIYNTFPLNPNEYADFLIENTRIVHFLSGYKPWNAGDVEYFNKCFELFRTAEAFVTEYWKICDEAVAFIEK